MPALESGPNRIAASSGESEMEVARIPGSVGIEALPPKRVYLMAAICMVVGLAAGYLSRGLVTSASHAVSASRMIGGTGMSDAGGPAAGSAGGTRMPTLDEMNRIADQQAAPLLAQLQSKPNDSARLSQVAAIYHGSHQFKKAAEYYSKAVEADPKDASLRSKLASSLYRSGDVDGALDQLNQALRYDPRSANALFNLGIVRLQGKGDAQGALAAWQRLLKANPQLSGERKAEVERLMADVMTNIGDQTHGKGATGK